MSIKTCHLRIGKLGERWSRWKFSRIIWWKIFILEIKNICCHNIEYSFASGLWLMFFFLFFFHLVLYCFCMWFLYVWNNKQGECVCFCHWWIYGPFGHLIQFCDSGIIELVPFYFVINEWFQEWRLILVKQLNFWNIGIQLESGNK